LSVGVFGHASIARRHSVNGDNKTFCVYLAENEAAIRRHGGLSGFPINKITEIDLIIDPTTANLRIPT
jgi:hypothetical protein